MEEARLFGGNRSAALWAHRLTNNYSLVDVNNSIMHRLSRLLIYAGNKAVGGSGGWARFLHRNLTTPGVANRTAEAPAPSGEDIQWEKVVLSGWSRGSAYPVHIAKYFPAARLVLFCGLEDYIGLRGPDSKPEPWIYTMRTKTPRDQIFGFGGLHGGCCSNWMTNWAETGLALPGQSFADDKEGTQLIAPNASALAAAMKGSRRIYLRGPKVGHGTPIYDWTMVRHSVPGEAGVSVPLYLPAWEYMLTTTVPPGAGTIPASSGLPCCFAYGRFIFAVAILIITIMPVANNDQENMHREVAIILLCDNAATYTAYSNMPICRHVCCTLFLNSGSEW